VLAEGGGGGRGGEGSGGFRGGGGGEKFWVEFGVKVRVKVFAINDVVGEGLFRVTEHRQGGIGAADRVISSRYELPRAYGEGQSGQEENKQGKHKSEHFARCEILDGRKGVSGKDFGISDGFRWL